MYANCDCGAKGRAYPGLGCVGAGDNAGPMAATAGPAMPIIVVIIVLIILLLISEYLQFNHCR